MKKHHHWIAMGFAIAVVASVQAGAAQAAADSRADLSASCKAAQLSAWFDQQRQITDGAVEPARTLPTPPECEQEKQAAVQDRDGQATDQAKAQHVVRSPHGPRG